MATHSSIPAWRIPMDRGAWWATVRRAAKSRTRLKWLVCTQRSNFHLLHVVPEPFVEQTVFSSLNDLVYPYQKTTSPRRLSLHLDPRFHSTDVFASPVSVLHGFDCFRFFFNLSFLLCKGEVELGPWQRFMDEVSWYRYSSWHHAYLLVVMAEAAVLIISLEVWIVLLKCGLWWTSLMIQWLRFPFHAE